MEFVILFLIVLSLIINLLFIRHTSKRVSEKITNFLRYLESQNTQIPVSNSTPMSTMGTIPKNPLFKNYNNVDAPSPNQIANEEDNLELSEQNFSNFPKGVKIEVEGGDTQAPLEYPVKN